MKVSDILRVKGNTLYTVKPDERLAQAAAVMAEKDIGSLVVMDLGDLVGMLTFREVIQTVVRNGGQIGTGSVRAAMDAEGAEFMARLQGPEAMEAMMAFFERRPPDFRQFSS